MPGSGTSLCCPVCHCCPLDHGASWSPPHPAIESHQVKMWSHIRHACKTQQLPALQICVLILRPACFSAKTCLFIHFTSVSTATAAVISGQELPPFPSLCSTDGMIYSSSSPPEPGVSLLSCWPQNKQTSKKNPKQTKRNKLTPFMPVFFFILENELEPLSPESHKGSNSKSLF